MFRPLTVLARVTARLVMRVVLLLVLVEGTASWLGFLLDLPEGVRPPERERLHMQYDPELGWTHIPGTRLENFYGDGRNLTISRQGLRATNDVSAESTAELTRAVCAGGELTLGVGVGDDDTWCAQLGARESELETLNMGQGGYGVDQSFLWYRRDGSELGTDLLLFAFTRESFARMERERYEHYAKPVLRRASSGDLQARNVPVPRPSEALPWLARNAPILDQLRIVELAGPAFRANWTEEEPQLTTGELADLTLGIFESLERLTHEQGATLVLVYLPSGSQLETRHDLWRRRIAQEARARGLAFVDLVEAQDALPPGEAEKLYGWPAGAEISPDAPLLTEAGHSWVAQALSERLRQLPELVAALDPGAAAIP